MAYPHKLRKEPNLTKIAFFWIGIIFLLFAGVINVAMIVFEIYPSATIGIIISLYTGLIGLLALFYTIRWEQYEFTDAITPIDRILLILGITITILSVIFLVISLIGIAMGILTVVIGISFLIGYYSIEWYIGKSWKAILFIILIIIGCFIGGLAIFIAGWTDILSFIILLISFGIALAYGIIQSIQPSPPPTSPPPPADDVSRRAFQIVLLIGLFITCAILIGSGFWLVVLILTPELILVGYVLMYLGIAFLIGTIALTVYLVLQSISPHDGNERTKLKFLLLGIIIGVLAGFLTGYLIVTYML